MTEIAVLAVLIISSCVCTGSCEDNFTNCHKDITVLQRALYRAENIKEMNDIFYPPRVTPSRFIKVTYKFDKHDCNVTYIWAIGGFLLMQPPKIFQLTSLYFSTIANHLTDLVIYLPEQCWPLVRTEGREENCTCRHEDDHILDILTQQVWNQYV